MYLKVKIREIGGEWKSRRKRNRDLLSAGLLPVCLGQARAHLGLPHGHRNPSTQTVFCCFPPAVSKELEQPGTHQNSYGMHATQAVTLLSVPQCQPITASFKKHLFLHVFERQKDRERDKEKQRQRDLSLAGSFSKCLQHIRACPGQSQELRHISMCPRG